MGAVKRIRDLKGLGEKSEGMLAQIGITSVDAFIEADPFELYLQLHKTLPSISLNMLYAMIGAQEDLPWQKVAKTRKTEILFRLDDMGIAP